MAMTKQAARQIVNQQTTPDDGSNPFGGSGGTSSGGGSSSGGLGPMPDLGEAQRRAYAGDTDPFGTNSDNTPEAVPPGYEAWPGMDGYYYNRTTNTVGYVDTKTGSNGETLTTWHKLTKGETEQFLATVNGTSPEGSPGTLAAQQNADTSRARLEWEMQQAADKAKVDAEQNKVVNAYNARGQDESIISDAQQGRLSVSDAMAKLAELRHQEQSDPFKYGEYLQHLQNLPAGSGNPLQSLIGSGVRIAPDYGSYDTVQKILESILHGYDSIPNLTDAERARDALTNPETHDQALDFFNNLTEAGHGPGQPYGSAIGEPDLPAYGFSSASGARDFASQIQGATPEQLEALRQMAAQATPHASGGSTTTDGPALLIDLANGRPRALVGEAGPEKLTVSPLKKMSAGGTVDTGSAKPYGGLTQEFADETRGASQEQIDALGRIARGEVDINKPSMPPNSSHGALRQAIEQYGQSPLAKSAMLLAASGLEGLQNPDGTWQAGDQGMAWGPYQLRGDIHAITRQDADDPMKATEYVSNDYNMAAEKVMREQPELVHSDPAQAAALVAFYAEHPAQMYDENHYRSAYAKIEPFAGGGTMQINLKGASLFNGAGFSDALSHLRDSPPITHPVGHPPIGPGKKPPTDFPLPPYATTGDPIQPSQPVDPSVGGSTLTGTTVSPAPVTPTGGPVEGPGFTPTPMPGPGTVIPTTPPKPSLTSIVSAISPTKTPDALAEAVTAPASVAPQTMNLQQMATAVPMTTAQTAATPPAPPPFVPPPNAISVRWTRAQYEWIMGAADGQAGRPVNPEKYGHDWDVDKYLVEASRQQWVKDHPTQAPVPPGKELDPASAQAISLGKALRPLGIAHPDMLAYLDRGQLPPPGTITQSFLAKLPPSLLALFQGIITAFGNKPEDYSAAQQQFDVKGMTLSGAAPV